MRLPHGHHLGYCTNIHRGESWAETFSALQSHALAVRERVCPREPFGIGLRLSALASRELSDPATLLDFQRWLEKRQCYVFTINGFPFGQFHGTRVKEQVYHPDWTTPQRVAYTNRLFDLLAQLLPAGISGSVSTLPGAFKESIRHAEAAKQVRDHIWHSVEHAARLSAETDRKLYLALEPEPLCLLESTGEVIQFFDCLRAEHPGDERLGFLGVNYDTCHLAVEFEEAANALATLQFHHIPISKIHLSNALSIHPTPEVLQALRAFADDVYLHQTVIRSEDGSRIIYRDLTVALDGASPPNPSDEWRIHFHIPLHSPPSGLFNNTAAHLLQTLDVLAADPGRCPHLEMETYTWEVLPADLKYRSVEDQLVAEYDWVLAALRERGLA